MITKIQLKEGKTPPINYPYWGIATTSSGAKRIVMFIEPKNGYVMHDEIGKELGNFVCGFNMADFKPFKDSLTIDFSE